MSRFFIIHSDCQGVFAAEIIGADAVAVEVIADPSKKSIARFVIADIVRAPICRALIT